MPEPFDTPASPRSISAQTLRRALLTALLCTGVISACSDGVQVSQDQSGASGGGGGTGGSGATSGGNSPDPDAEPPEPGAAPVEPPASSLDATEVDAARFLMQASFGPTRASIDELVQIGSEATWIDQQLALPASLTEPYTRANSNGSKRVTRHQVWWANALDAPDQLRQRVAFALSQIFVVSDLDYALGNAQYGMTNYYDMLARNAFGNFRQLLEDVTLHPVMGVYLSMVRNEKANPAMKIRPDENYAREVLQLFSIGLHELNPRGEAQPAGNPTPAYTQSTVEEFARVFTGWDYPTSRFWGDTNITPDFFTGPMVPSDEFHDFEAKTLLSGTVAPAGLSVRDDMNLALDNIFNHPNVGPFIGKQLIQRLVTSNPTPGYVERVASVFNDNGAGVRGDLAATVRAILLDNEARNGHLTNSDFGKLREPVVRMLHFYRALNATPGPEANGIHATADFPVDRMDEMGGQAVMKSASVFNFYRPDNTLVPGGDWLSPEMQIMTEANLAATHNNYHHQIYRFHTRANLRDDNPRVTIIDMEPLVALAGNLDDLLDWYDLVLYAGAMPATLRATLREYMGTLGDNDAGRFARVQDTLFMITVSPAHHIQR